MYYNLNVFLLYLPFTNIDVDALSMPILLLNDWAGVTFLYFIKPFPIHLSLELSYIY